MTLSWHNEASTLQTILQGMGDQHIDVAIRRAETKFQVGLHIELPRVPYRESITKQNSAMYRHKKQTGGSGQFGEVHLRVEPLSEGDFEFENEVVGGAISSSYMSAIEKGIHAVMQHGAVAGYPMEKIRVAVFDGKEHPVDSKPIAFEIAGREAFKLAVHGASPVLLEPIMTIQVVGAGSPTWATSWATSTPAARASRAWTTKTARASSTPPSPWRKSSAIPPTCAPSPADAVSSP